MTSVVAWLDTDDDERRRMRELIAMFRDQGAVDELGMGRIRDAFSNRLFPGTSVLWSRARYLLFVPWIYNGLEDGAGAPGTAEDRARKLQKRLAKSLNARHGAGSGVIGASGADVRQPPDLILWAALGDWGIRLDPGRMSQVREECVARSVRRSELEGEVDHGVGLWHPVVNRLLPSGFPDDVSLDLTPAEAAFLAELIASPDALAGTSAAARADSLLAQLVEFGCPTDVDVPWDHPAPTASIAPPGIAGAPADPWRNMFEAADESAGGLEPFWIYRGDARIERHVPAEPMSIDRHRLDELVRLMGIYRLAFGQPRQEELLAALAASGVDGESARDLVMDLTPT